MLQSANYRILNTAITHSILVLIIALNVTRGLFTVNNATYAKCALYKPRVFPHIILVLTDRVKERNDSQLVNRAV